MKFLRLRWVFVALAASASLASTGSPAAAQDGESATKDVAVTTVSPKKEGNLTAPPAPATAEENAGVAATSPWVSPFASSVHVNPGAPYTCSLGNFCTFVWDYTTNNWELFYLYNCAEYTLFYWNGGGYHQNNQTGGAVGHFYNSGHGEILPSAPANNTLTYRDWNPVYFIRNC